ncbi:MAG: FecR domain-containing protein [Bauldia sp.]|nr:FecR domain-containing protein [Bauldia sp.]
MRFVAACSLAISLAVTSAYAAEEIGAAAVAKNEVTGTLGDLVRTLSAGDPVSGNETVSTGTNSAALLKFLDDSDLNLGASSTVVLDRFVYDPSGSADSAVINLTKGAMRFVTGHSDPSKFKIKTQVATLGIRGTDFVVLCDGSDRCAVVVSKGIVRICPRPDRPVDCDTSYDLDKVENFSIVGEDGENTGAKSISPKLVAAVVKAVATGQDGLTIAKIESGNLYGVNIPSVGRRSSVSPN